MNRYEIFNENNVINGCISVEYVIYADSEKRAVEIAEENGINLDGYTIELGKEDVKDELHRSYKEGFFRE